MAPWFSPFAHNAPKAPPGPYDALPPPPKTRCRASPPTTSR
jgi:hypothetical protein